MYAYVHVYAFSKTYDGGYPISPGVPTPPPSGSISFTSSFSLSDVVVSSSQYGDGDEVVIGVTFDTATPSTICTRLLPT
jgi:hypothetical protein